MSKLHLHFEGSLGMYHYQVGIASVIAEKYGHKLKNTYITSSSAGFVGAVLLKLYPNIQFTNYLSNMCFPLLEDAQSKNTGVFFNWNNCVRKMLKNVISNYEKKNNENIFTRLKNELGIFILQKQSFCNLNFKNKIIEDWENENEFIDCVVSSTFIPIFDSWKLTSKYKNTQCIDSSLFSHDSILKNILKNKDKQLIISTKMFRKVPYHYYMVSTNKDFVEKLYNLGRTDALDNINVFEDFFNSK